MRPGARVRTASGKLARVLWSNDDRVGVFFIEDRGCAYGVLPRDAVELVSNESVFASLDSLSLEELRARLQPVITKKPDKAAVRKSLSHLSVEELAALVEQLKREG